MNKVRLLDRGLTELSSLLDEMSKIAQQTVSASITAYLEGGDVTLQVRQWSDTLLNYYQKVGEKSVELIARFQPVARDLRFIRASMEIAYDLSRFGRYAYDISMILKTLGGRVEFGRETVAEMGGRTMRMIENSIEAYKSRDQELAERVREDDMEVDKMYLEHLQYCVNNPPRKVEQLISDVLTVRHLERIADHAVDLADATLYMLRGEYSSIWR
ncbi:MAG: PhoU domain-containing protein [Candidatus Bathyarchaeia archaeon]